MAMKLSLVEDGGERVVHDFGDARAVVAEAFEFGLRVLDVEGAGEAAFGGQCIIHLLQKSPLISFFCFSL